jgi:hypothetical protein
MPLNCWDSEECKRLSAMYDVCLPDLAALGAPEVTGIFRRKYASNRWAGADVQY